MEHPITEGSLKQDILRWFYAPNLDKTGNRHKNRSNLPMSRKRCQASRLFSSITLDEIMIHVTQLVVGRKMYKQNKNGYVI